MCQRRMIPQVGGDQLPGDDQPLLAVGREGHLSLHYVGRFQRQGIRDGTRPAANVVGN